MTQAHASASPASVVALGPKTLGSTLLWIAIAAITLASISTTLAFTDTLVRFWHATVWTRLPTPLAVFTTTTATWWIALLLAAAILVVARRIRDTTRENMHGGAPVILGVFGGGGRALWRKLNAQLPSLLKSSTRMVGVFPEDRRRDATVPLASRLNPNAHFVEVPPGQGNQQAALAAHETYATTYGPVLRQGFEGASRALLLLHQGGHTGAVAGMYACRELASEPKEAVFLVMGDSSDALVACISDPHLYEKARRARAAEAEPAYAWTRDEPRVVEVV